MRVVDIFKDKMNSIALQGLNVRRTFYNVGQALFCKEQVENISIVYDCGGENESIIQDAIHRAFKRGDNIDMLFLSHYDRDHINGVFELLNYCNVHHLILPMLSNLHRFIEYEDMHTSSLEVEIFFNDAEEYIRQHQLDTKVHYVTNSLEGDTYGSLESLPKEIASNSIIRGSGSPKWLYKVYNRLVMDSKTESMFLEKLGLPSTATFDSIKEKWAQQKLSIKKALKNLGIIKIEKINDYSMTLYSGCDIKNSGCLYLGDYNAKQYFNELYNAYRDVWPTIDIIQVPHHGSENNFNDNLITKGGKYIISNKEKPASSRDVDSSKVEIRITAGGGQVITTFDGDKTP